MPESVEVTVAQLSGKLDALGADLKGRLDSMSTKLDSNRELLMARIDAGDRESMQSVRLLEERIGSVIERGKERDGRLDALEAQGNLSVAFQAKLYGVVIGVGLAAGAGGVGLAKALGL